MNLTSSADDPSPPLRVPAIGLVAVDALLVFYAAWCLLPNAIWGKPSILSLPFGGRFRGTLSAPHLYQFWLILFIRQHLGARDHRPGILSRCAADLSPTFRAIVLFAATLTVFLTIQPRLGPTTGDTLGARLLPVSILREGNLDLDEFYPGLFRQHRYAVGNYNGHWYPKFPIFVGLTATPVYAMLSVLLPESSSRWVSAYTVPDQDLGPNVVNSFEQTAAAIIAALSVVIVWRFAQVVSGATDAMPLWIAVAYGFGTPVLSSASRALWMHGPSCLFLGAAALALFRPTRRVATALFVGGLCVGWAYATRPSNGLFVPLLLAWAFAAKGRAAIYLGLGLGLSLCVIFLVNASIYETIFGGYAQFASIFVGGFDPAAFATILLSPSRGLFVFSPYLLIPVVLAVTGLPRSGSKFPGVLLVAAAASTVLVACYEAWSGGYSFGPRLLCETGLLLTLVLPFYLDRLGESTLARSIFLGLVIFSCHVHVMGVRYGDEWTAKVFRGEQQIARFWDIRDSQLAWTLSGATGAK